jgi:hypothetical protein
MSTGEIALYAGLIIVLGLFGWYFGSNIVGALLGIIIGIAIAGALWKGGS